MTDTEIESEYSADFENANGEASNKKSPSKAPKVGGRDSLASLSPAVNMKETRFENVTVSLKPGEKKSHTHISSTV